MSARVLEGSCLTVMPTLAENSVDSVICDPPYGLKFMGKEWDHGIPGKPFWIEALRVAKPGAYLLAFGGTRTHHRLMVAIEDAGWEIRDCLMWLYGSGFPKSLDVSKAIDKAAGATREVRGVNPRAAQQTPNRGTVAFSGPAGTAPMLTIPATDAAKQWEGWGTALKPAWEPIILARKPISGTVASNVQEHGTGAINIDGCRIGMSELDRSRINSAEWNATNLDRRGFGQFEKDGQKIPLQAHDLGRWPANLLLDEESAALLDGQTGETTSGSHLRGTRHGLVYGGGVGPSGPDGVRGHNDTGGASRFFYTAKASRSEREAGLAGMPEQMVHRAGHGNDEPDAVTQRFITRARNFHPTVKPLDLMQWLCRLVTPKGGLILDPFCGSGSTGRAAIAEGFGFIGIELSPEYAAIARARITEYAPLFGDVA